MTIAEQHPTNEEAEKFDRYHRGLLAVINNGPCPLPAHVANTLATELNPTPDHERLLMRAASLGRLEPDVVPITTQVRQS